MTVTARNFLGAMKIENHEDRFEGTWHGSAERIIVERWDAILSRARQEAYSEGRLAGLEEMYNAWDCYHGASEIKGLKYLTQKAKESIENLAKEYFGK